MSDEISVDMTDDGPKSTLYHPWQTSLERPSAAPLIENQKTDVLIVGAGITGALLAEHLSARGLSVVIVDEWKPGLTATAASTGMLQWELDIPLADLVRRHGFERAIGIYRRSAAAVTGLSKLISEKKIACQLKSRKTLYLASNHEGARDLLEEVKLRRRGGLPGVYLEHCDLFTQYELDRDAGILSAGSAEVNPVLLTASLLKMAITDGAKCVAGRVVSLNSEPNRVTAELAGSSNTIEAQHVVLATGHEMPGIAMPKLHRTVATYAIATESQAPGSLWRDEASIWDDSHPYLYVRPAPDGRLLVGGEDDLTIDAAERASRLSAKADLLREKLRLLWPKANLERIGAWSGVYSDSKDGIPFIGPVSQMPNVYSACGYGGNGMSFSYLATLMIGAMISGVERDWFADFALDRDEPPHADAYEFIAPQASNFAEMHAV
ncbi:NAD(P)/FAD-dependent oxidoreductase [Oryzifoliimicrobium ureilyticus]|uniref:NAD(P)/FAD-dependent oxidoreductase n=1 Tax=Oryzifoliimicrobium ureilyticus TaxID=3113724 RepID=UPI00307658CA